MFNLDFNGVIMKRVLFFILALFLTLFAEKKKNNLISRDIFFAGKKQFAAPCISPDGKKLAYFRRVTNLQGLVVCNLTNDRKYAVLEEIRHRMANITWAYDNRHLLYLGDPSLSTENWCIYKVDTNVKNGKPFNLAYLLKIQTRLLKLSPKFPAEVLVAMNIEDERLHDVYRIDIITERRKQVAKNNGTVLQWFVDDSLKIRGAQVSCGNDSNALAYWSEPNAEWNNLFIMGPSDGLGSVWFNSENQVINYGHNMNSDLMGYYTRELPDGTDSLVYMPKRGEVTQILRDNDSKAILAVIEDYLMPRWQILSPTVQKDIQLLEKFINGVFYITDMDQADSTWIVMSLLDNAPPHYYLHDRRSGKTEMLFSTRPELDEVTLSKVEPVKVTAHDGLDLPAYLTKPHSHQGGKLPLVLLVHGGPFARDRWGYEPIVQLLANRGYAVLQVNFRGSTGFGKSFLSAGFGEWGGKMNTDLLDAVSWAVKKGIADPARIAIMGFSYGGYAALYAVSQKQTPFKCAIDVCGPTDLLSFFKNAPKSWDIYMKRMRARIGGWEKDTDYFNSISPLKRVNAMSVPLFIAHGRQDIRVKVQESHAIVDTLKKLGKNVTYLEFPDEGHQIAYARNLKALLYAIEKFLSNHLGGEYEPPTTAERNRLFQLVRLDKAGRVDVSELGWKNIKTRKQSHRR